MIRSIRLLLAIIILSCCGCSITNPGAMTPSEDQVTFPTSKPFQASASTSLLASATPIQKLQFLEPTLSRRCPDQRRVSIQELGLDPRLQLILLDVNEQPPLTIYILSDLEIKAVPIPFTLNTSGYNLSNFFPWNDSGSIILKYDSLDGSQSSFWLSTLDGESRHEFALLDWPLDYLFVSDYFVVLGDPPDDLRLHPWEYVPFYSVNVVTDEKQEFPQFNTHIAYLDFFIIDGTQAYLGYQPFFDEHHSYYLYDYATGDNRPIFQWLDVIEGWYGLIPSITYREGGGFITVVQRSYGFDISKELSIEEMQEPAPYHEMMHAIVMPGEDSQDIQTLAYVQNDPIPIIRTHYDPELAEDRFYIFDYDKKDLTEYCLEGVLTGRIFVSPNGLFLSIDIYPEAYIEVSPPGPSAVLILNLLTGNYSIIDNYLSTGWLINTELD